MRTRLLHLVLAVLAGLTIATSAFADGSRLPTNAYLEMRSDGVHAARSERSQSQCECRKLGVCGQQQTLGLEGCGGEFFQRSLMAVLKPLRRSEVLLAHIPELDPPPPRTNLC
ncbi:MAG: hypothetical protein K0U74_02810 [Alphaproteobacteria bacterium]|nr:hypothetical protein [Alphaproteobacteria bacterium]